MAFVRLEKEQLFVRECHAERKSKAPTILFIHGNFSSHCWWDDIMKVLPASYHLLSIDLRGFGKSTYNNKCGTFGDWAHDIVELCQLLNISQVYAVGMSFGGAVAMKLAQIGPSLVLRVLLTSSVSHEGLLLAPSVHSKVDILANSKASFMLSLLETKNHEGMRQIYNAVLFAKVSGFVSEQTKHKLLQTAFEQRCYLQLLFALANSDININKIKCRVRIIHGSEDKVVPLSSVRMTGEYFKSLEIWEGHQHMLPFEDPERYLQTVLEFIA